MDLETFDDVKKSISKCKDRKFHLLLGNGFSIAYDFDIFSYNKLYDFISAIEDDDLAKILGVIDTKNFELIMQQLDSFLSLARAFDGDSVLLQRLEQASNKLKTDLLDAVNALHPEHVFTVPEDQSKACSEYLRTFLATNGSIFSTNYDLLLYWILMRNHIEEHNDGFGMELENADENPSEEDQVWSDLIWGPNREKQNVFYLHGALPFFDRGYEISKETYDKQHYLRENISQRMEQGEYPIFVTAGDGQQKLTHIMHNRYLTFCYESLCSIEGSLVSFGFNFGEYDDHIIDAINRAAKFGKNVFPKLVSLYIGVYNDEDRAHIEKIAPRFNCKVRIFNASSANVWGKN